MDVEPPWAAGSAWAATMGNQGRSWTTEGAENCAPLINLLPLINVASPRTSGAGREERGDSSIVEMFLPLRTMSRWSCVRQQRATWVGGFAFSRAMRVQSVVDGLGAGLRNALCDSTICGSRGPGTEKLLKHVSSPGLQLLRL